MKTATVGAPIAIGMITIMIGTIANIRRGNSTTFLLQIILGAVAQPLRFFFDPSAVRATMRPSLLIPRTATFTLHSGFMNKDA
jgi:hypothetical protein